MINNEIEYILKALNLASKVHENHTREFGPKPYINHCIRVSANSEVVKYGYEAICVGLMHDCIEDSDEPEKIKNYIKDNFNENIYNAVILLTHNTDKYTYEEYCNIIKNSYNKLALVVKYADSLDNSVSSKDMNKKWLDRCLKYRLNAEQYLSILNKMETNI